MRGTPLTALLGLEQHVEFEPMTPDEHETVENCYRELRTGHPGKHFTMQLWGSNDQQQIRVSFRNMGVQTLEEITEIAARHGLKVSLSADELAIGSTISGQVWLSIGPIARPKDAAADTLEQHTGQVH